jgi:ABC-2 type transport system permease protein
MKGYLAQVRAELALSLRQGEQMLVAIGIPLLVLVFFANVDVLPESTTPPLTKAAMEAGMQGATVDWLFPRVLALAIVSTAFVALGIGTGFERQYKVLKRLGATPLGRGRLVAAKITVVLALEALQLVVLVPVALLLGWRFGGLALDAPLGTGLALTLAAYVLGTAAFAGLGLLLAGLLRGTLNLAVTNGLYVVLLLAGGLAVPASRLPGPLEALSKVLPAGALAEVLSYALGWGTTTPTMAWGVLAAWAVVLPVAAAVTFRWE